MSTQEKEWALITEFTSAADIYHAAEKLRDEGYKKFECYTPFPIHGMDDAQGIKATKLPWLILACGLFGFATALGLLAAIPAVVAYNKFNSDSRRYFSKIENFSKRFLSII